MPAVRLSRVPNQILVRELRRRSKKSRRVSAGMNIPEKHFEELAERFFDIASDYVPRPLDSYGVATFIQEELAAFIQYLNNEFMEYYGDELDDDDDDEWD